jgi:hypothetical protein
VIGEDPAVTLAVRVTTVPALTEVTLSTPELTSREAEVGLAD